ncbi:MAG: hypothetical protein KUG81_05425 [Gammaproteobacteria bacterium]|nr:hypothetical protein [Gammaproteobacteria bacterium]
MGIAFQDHAEDHRDALLIAAGMSRDIKIGVEVEAYPAGVITTATARFLLDQSDEVSFRTGYNTTDRQDFGEHDDETGGGPGAGFGYRHFLRAGHAGPFLGGRLDVWSLEIDWKENGTSGTTDVIVAQPTAEVGYAWRVDEGLQFTTNLALGAEFNVDTEGEDVGEGVILLLGFGLTYGF